MTGVRSISGLEVTPPGCFGRSHRRERRRRLVPRRLGRPSWRKPPRLGPSRPDRPALHPGGPTGPGPSDSARLNSDRVRATAGRTPASTVPAVRLALRVEWTGLDGPGRRADGDREANGATSWFLLPGFAGRGREAGAFGRDRPPLDVPIQRSPFRLRPIKTVWRTKRYQRSKNRRPSPSIPKSRRPSIEFSEVSAIPR